MAGMRGDSSARDPSCFLRLDVVIAAAVAATAAWPPGTDDRGNFLVPVSGQAAAMGASASGESHQARLFGEDWPGEYSEVCAPGADRLGVLP